MVREFDEVVFTGEIGKVLGPVKTQFGYHLIEITSRKD
jgi:peptidyl-prolyl cis-trans isomerase C